MANHCLTNGGSSPGPGNGVLLTFSAPFPTANLPRRILSNDERFLKGLESKSAPTGLEAERLAMGTRGDSAHLLYRKAETSSERLQSNQPSLRI